ncbi:MAG: LLM class flavin-dependent oxidoreductase [Kibdelosporangium sp.]
MVKIGINLAGLAPAAEARHAEDLGLDSMWAGDHLANDMPGLDCTLALAAASAATTSLSLGMVMQLALRPAAWAAKQIGSLQTLSGNRIELGVGVGGEWPDEWAAAGMSLSDRGRRTDAALEALPGLLAGQATPTPDTGVTIRLLPAAPVPPVWIAGGSGRAQRRAAAHGTGWLPAMVTPKELSAGLTSIAGRTDRQVQGGVQLFGALGTTTEALAHNLNKWYSLPADRAARILLGGAPTQIAERLAEFTDAGASHITVATSGPNWQIQAELLAEAKRLL